jgi:ribosomal-protein-serine acetyltransferase
MNPILFPPTIIAPGIILRATTLEDATEMYAVVERNRTHLAQWLAWVSQTRDAGDIEIFLAGALDGARRGSNITCVIVRDEKMVGAIGLHRLDSPERCAEIGYWLAKDASGHGIMTQAVQSMMVYAFTQRRIHRLELLAAVGNARSRKVAERLGMAHEATLRERLHVNGRFHDVALYARLAQDGERATREE